MKKILALLLAFAMLFCFVGCDKDTTTNDDTTTTTTTTQADDNVNVDDTTAKTETTTKKTETTTKTTNTQPVTIQKKDFGNGQIVFYPSNISESSQKFPIIAFANGTGFSYDIYESLLVEIAKGGYVVIANTETMSGDGVKQLESVDFLIGQNKNSSSIFYNKLNTEKIGLAGHSQGGRSAVNAAAKDSRIDCVVSFAGSNYTSEAEKLSTPTFFIGGSADMIVLASQWVVPAYQSCKGPAIYACMKNAIHTRCCTNPTEYTKYAIPWFNAWLKNDAGAKEIFRNGGKLSQDSAWQDFQCKGI